MFNRFSKIFSLTAMSVLLLYSQAAFANNNLFTDNCCEPTTYCQPVCETPCYNASKLIVSAELVYLKPTYDQQAYVISSKDANSRGDEHFPNGKRHLRDPDFKPGFRVGALYNLCCPFALEGRFTYLNGSDSNSTSGDFLYIIGFDGEGAQDAEDNFYSGTSSAHDRYKYYAADLTLNRTSLTSCIDNLNFMVGLHYAYIKHKMHNTHIGTFDAGAHEVNDDWRSSSRFWGIGPQIGLDYKYNLTDAQCSYGIFALTTDVRASILCSNTTSTLHYSGRRTEGTEGVNMNNGHQWRVTPAVDAKLGGCYSFTCSCYTALIEAGYEWIWYANAVDDIRSVSPADPGNTIDAFGDLSLQGPYVSLSVGF